MSDILNILRTLFMNTKTYSGRKKESFNELRRCFEIYTNEYISEEDFRKLLISVGLECNKNGDFKLKMKPEIRKRFFI